MNDIDLEHMLVGQVDALVRVMSETIVDLNPERPSLEIYERLYRVLAANCERKAELSKEAFEARQSEDAA